MLAARDQRPPPTLGTLQGLLVFMADHRACFLETHLLGSELLDPERAQPVGT